MSREKRAESCLKIPQNSQKRFVQIRVIRGTSFAISRTLREIILSDEKVFIPLSIELEKPKIIKNMPYYIQIQEHGKLKLVNCVEITQQEANSQEYNNCLVVDNHDTAKAITCLLGNIDRNATPLDLILRLADIIQHLNTHSNNYLINERVGLNGTITQVHI